MNPQVDDHYLYVADAQDWLLGVIDIKELLKLMTRLSLKDIIVEHFIRLPHESTLKKAAAIFVRYGFRAIPVTDENNRLICVVPYWDIMNIMRSIV